MPRAARRAPRNAPGRWRHLPGVFFCKPWSAPNDGLALTEAIPECTGDLYSLMVMVGGLVVATLQSLDLAEPIPRPRLADSFCDLYRLMVMVGGLVVAAL